jgi:hypothetical protein
MPARWFSKEGWARKYVKYWLNVSWSNSAVDLSALGGVLGGAMWESRKMKKRLGLQSSALNGAAAAVGETAVEEKLDRGLLWEADRWLSTASLSAELASSSLSLAASDSVAWLD